jgi:asparagine synthase (glutamine-hydrolysing)
MCGIAGIIDPRGGVETGTIVRMRDTLEHRGPDDAGAWICPTGQAGLGHRRLSILDLSPRGHQPMLDREQTVAIVYNGEVYNFREIRKDLKSAGFAFHSDTDTEVILNAYLAWGIDCVDRLEGMFAFAVYDTRTRTCHLVRDRLGVKPLFYACVDGRLVFGSEIRAVLASECVRRDLSPEAAWDYFSTGYVPTPATIYQDIAKLPPAHVLTFSGGRMELNRYWDVSFEHLDDDPATAERRLLEHIDSSVADYLVADVPTGAFLSGGVDSSVITQRAAAVFANHGAPGRRLGGTDLHTFSIGFDVEKHSELDAANASAAQFGTVHTPQIVTREMAHEAMDTVVDLFDEPFAASSTIPMLFVSRLARRRVTVALCGEGGDEAFGGYSWYRTWLDLQKPSFWKTAIGRGVRIALEKITRHRKKKWRLHAMESVDQYAQLMGAMTGPTKRRIFSPDMSRQLADRDNAGYFRKYWRDDLPPMARMQYLDLCTFLPDLNLTRADRTSMHVSLELRVPFLNHRLIEYACGLGQDVRNPDNRLKGLFKHAVRDRLPQAIRQRKKKGFSAPVKQWFTPADLVKLISDVRAEHPDLAAAWLHPSLERNARTITGTRGYKLWIFLKWLRKNA